MLDYGKPDATCDVAYNDTNFKDCRGHEKEFNSKQTKKVSLYVQILILYNVTSYIINNNSCYYSSLCWKNTKADKLEKKFQLTG